MTSIDFSCSGVHCFDDKILRSLDISHLVKSKNIIFKYHTWNNNSKQLSQLFERTAKLKKKSARISIIRPKPILSYNFDTNVDFNIYLLLKAKAQKLHSLS